MSGSDSPSFSRTRALFSFLLFNALGVFIFFVSISAGGRNTVVLDHICTWFRSAFGAFIPWVTAALMLCCLADTFFLRRIWRKNATELLMSAAKLSGFVIMIMGLTGIGAETFPALFDRRIIPFIMDNLIGTMFTALVVAIFFMPFLVDYGLLEFCGVLLRPVMRPLFRTPGTPAVIAVTAFVGSFTIGVLATEQMYREGKFTARESVIITTGFSTTSIAMMMVLAQMMGIMEHWSFYFWTTLAITFGVTAITARLRPISRKADNFYPGAAPCPEKIVTSRILHHAWEAGLARAGTQAAPHVCVARSLRMGFRMLMTMMSTVPAFATLGLYLGFNTSVFQYIGYVFAPFLMPFALPAPDMSVAMTASAMGSVDMMVGPIYAASAGELGVITRYLMALVPVSMVAYLSGYVPCIKSTEIPVSFSEIFLIWFERTALSLLAGGTLAVLFLA